MWFLKYPFLIWVCSASHIVRFGQVPRWNPCLDVFPIFSRKTLGIDGGDIPCCGAQCYGLQCSCWPAAAEVFSGWEERFGKDLQSDVSPFILSQSSPSTTSHHPLDWDFFPRRNAEICCQQKELKFLQLDEYSMGSPGPSHHNNACFSCFHLKVFNKAWIDLESRIWGLDEYDMGSSGPNPCMNMSWAHLVQVHFTKACKVLNKARINLESAGFCYFWPHWLETSWTLASQKRYIQRDYSLVHLVWPNTESLISQPFMGNSKIRLLLQDPVSPRYIG